ncbi:TetR/AcrR family transcriptional regulator [Nocardioides dongkuii]|uniref:TetR/AcrR family transcriptional regulator n=1 Tax=Nocardioides dongkuii TaxID=2760089 RepID=UPI001FD2D536|nr:TetR/AcrR family transcriptional regulator [Nocardioides dongkuii]
MSSISIDAPKRADARKNIAAILDAATVCLAVDPAVSLNDIAAAAGVGRVTLYGHFGNRAALVTQVVDRAMAVSDAELEKVDLDGDAHEALGRLLVASWHVTHRYGGLVMAAQEALSDHDLREAHDKPVRRFTRLLRRARREGSVRTDMPLNWQVTTAQGVIHAASVAVHRNELDASRAPGLVRSTVLAALTPPGRPVP